MNFIDSLPLEAKWVEAEKPSNAVLICLHGCGGRMSDFEGMKETLDLSGLNYLFLTGPESYYTGYRWYHSTASTIGASRILEEVFTALSQNGYASSDCVLLGFSQGAVLTLEFGSRYSSCLAGYVVMSGRSEDLPSLIAECDEDVRRNGRWLFTHGVEDKQLSAGITRQQVQRLEAEGFHIDYQEFDKGHEFDASEEFPYLRKWLSKTLDLK
jgi:predicted esterase